MVGTNRFLNRASAPWNYVVISVAYLACLLFGRTEKDIIL
jgi:hypothetical protein